MFHMSACRSCLKLTFPDSLESKRRTKICHIDSVLTHSNCAEFLQVIQGLEWVKDNYVSPAVVVMALGGMNKSLLCLIPSYAPHNCCTCARHHCKRFDLEANRALGSAMTS